MRASPGTTHTFDIIKGHGCVHIIWPATGRDLDGYRVERIGDTGHRYRVLPGHHVMGALEWHERPGVRAFSIGDRPRRVDRLMGRIRCMGL